ncbi:MAG: PAS domain S-box protein [Planctomycetes bacterium]|nr:PAS domain S-box protein [Planctomycetota bacterium]
MAGHDPHGETLGQLLAQLGTDGHLFKDALDAVDSLVVVLDPQGHIITGNQACEAWAGGPQIDLRGSHFSEVADGEDQAAQVRAALAEAGDRGRTGIHETWWALPNGMRRLIAWSACTVRGHNGQPICLVTTGQDITARRGSEEALRESERTLSTLMSNLPGMAYRCRNDDQWTMEYVSEGCRSLTGYEQAALQNNRDVSFADLILPEDIADVWQQVQTSVSQSRPFRLTYRIRTAQGEEKWVFEQGRKVGCDEGGVVMLEGFITDITDRVWAEEALRFTQFSVDKSSIGVNWADSSGRFLYANEAFCRLLGYSKQEILKTSISALDETLLGRQWPQSLAALKREKSLTRETEVRDKNGERIPVEVTANYLKYRDKEYVVSFVRDTRERRQAQEALREQEETLRLLSEHSSDGINVAEFDPETCKRRLVSCNRRYVEMSGYTREQLEAAENLDELVDYPHTRQERREWYDKILAGTPFHGMGSWRRPDGRENHYEWTAAPQRRGDHILIFGIDRDVTERIRSEREYRRLEEQLLQVQKLEAIGELAGGVAHDFNNLLTGIIGYANLLKSNQHKEEETAEIAGAIEVAAHRAARLTSQLLGFARRGKNQNIPVDLHGVVREVVDLLGRTVDKNINIHSVLNASPSTVMGDPGQMQQIVLNLAVNARDAMLEGGELTIRTECVELGEEYCRLHAEVSPGNYLCLSVMDTGVGIPRDVLPRIFEPFFTTKESPKGTGMGLSMVYGIVKNHGGSVQVYSEVGHGSTFRVYLPVTAEAPADRRHVAPPQPVLGHGRILLIDDEPVVRQTAVRMLSELGYEVIVASDGREAQEIYVCVL